MKFYKFINLNMIKDLSIMNEKTRAKKAIYSNNDPKWPKSEVYTLGTLISFFNTDHINLYIYISSLNSIYIAQFSL